MGVDRQNPVSGQGGSWAHAFRSRFRALARSCWFKITLRARIVAGVTSMHSSGAQNSKYCSRESRSEEHTSELQSRGHLVCRLLLEKKKKKIIDAITKS